MIAIRKFHNFRDWNIDRILFSKELLSTYPMEKLGNIIVPRKDKVRPADVPKEKDRSKDTLCRWRGIL